MEENKNKNIEGLLKWIIVTILCFVIFLTIFITGILVGQERARYSFQWAENYHRNFGGPPQQSFSDFTDAKVINVHGIYGQVLKIEGNTIIVKSQDNMEKMIVVLEKTVLINQYGEILLTDIKMGNNIVIIGDPNQQGGIEAKFIRVFPAGTKPISYCGNEVLKQ